MVLFNCPKCNSKESVKCDTNHLILPEGLVLENTIDPCTACDYLPTIAELKKTKETP